MQTKNTIILAIVTISIIAVAIVAGVITQQPAQPTTPQPVKQQEKPLPTKSELESTLLKEQPAIDLAITSAYPQLASLYVVEPGKLYHDGTWYGTTLTYIGSDEMNRDTLRLLMHKKDGTWKVRSMPPSIVLRAADYPDAPKSIIQDLNTPAPLPATDGSPAIN